MKHGIEFALEVFLVLFGMVMGLIAPFVFCLLITLITIKLLFFGGPS